jgi:DNA polymerase III delta subunit
MQMLDRAGRIFAETEVEPSDIIRVDVPGRGASEDGDGALRPELEPAVPTLQSASLFGGKQGLLLVDANHLRAAEAEVLADLIDAADPNAVQVVIVSGGSIPAALTKAVKSHGESMSVAKLRERDVAGWLSSEATTRKMKLGSDAQTALLERFGSDVASLGQALDQLSMASGSIDADTVRSLFRNRPDEPMWRIGDAIGKGDVATALRRLADYLTHGHPLVLLAFLENDVRKRALAAAAPDIETFAEWANVKVDAYPTKLAWRARGRVSDSDLQRAVDAFVRADHTLKTAPEAVHRVTLERLVVALCRWYA